jgi:U4/U6.U5 tri-snRNP-associated protein 1
MRSVLQKYDEEMELTHKSSFQIGRDVEEEIVQKRKLLEIKAKLQNKRVDSLNTLALVLANDCYNEEELASFKKPKKKIRKIRQKLKADDLLAIAGDATSSKDFGSRKRPQMVEADVETNEEFISDMNLEVDDDLEQMLSKARRLKQKESMISKAITIDSVQLKTEVKSEPESDEEMNSNTTKTSKDSTNIILNATAEFCRTLGDIPTYGQAGMLILVNKNFNFIEMIYFEIRMEQTLSIHFNLKEIVA